jgi:hypothetical protein
MHLMFSFFPKTWKPVGINCFVLNPKSYLEGEHRHAVVHPPVNWRLIFIFKLPDLSRPCLTGAGAFGKFFVPVPEHDT